MKNPHDIILRPVLTEKSYDQIADRKYTFIVDVDANKTEIKRLLKRYLKSKSKELLPLDKRENLSDKVCMKAVGYQKKPLSN